MRRKDKFKITKSVIHWKDLLTVMRHMGEMVFKTTVEVSDWHECGFVKPIRSMDVSATKSR